MLSGCELMVDFDRSRIDAGVAAPFQVGSTAGTQAGTPADSTAMAQSASTAGHDATAVTDAGIPLTEPAMGK